MRTEVTLKPTDRDAVIAAMLRWSEEFIEQPQPVFGDLPICPFAKAARLRDTIRFEVRPFDVMDSLEDEGDMLTLIREFSQQPEFETLFVIHPKPARISVRPLETFVSRLNTRMAAQPATCHLQVFEVQTASSALAASIPAEDRTQAFRS